MPDRSSPSKMMAGVLNNNAAALLKMDTHLYWSLLLRQIPAEGTEKVRLTSLPAMPR